jgi:DNA-directed RNA polymerase specialized sigma24 family protein
MVERPINRLKIDNSLTPVSFDSLLAFLGPDRESAAQAYLELRRALFTYFAVRGMSSPDEMADETINRGARRLGEGTEVTSENPSSYFYGVAYNVWRESLASPNVLIPLSDDDPGPSTQTTPYDLIINARERIESDVRYECLEGCLNQLDSGERELIISYYQLSGGEKIENRKKLAASLGLSGNALRQKVARSRSKLAECVNNCQRSRAS